MNYFEFNRQTAALYDDRQSIADIHCFDWHHMWDLLYVEILARAAAAALQLRNIYQQ